MNNIFGDDKFAFEAWKTPFENSDIQLVSLNYSEIENEALFFRVRLQDTGSIYRIFFEQISAFRVLDEGGLCELWEKSSSLGGRPGRTTFKVRNDLWTKESPISFLRSDGWSFVVASNADCVEIAAETAPTITLEC